MGTILNPGNELFRETVQSEIYVDKTLLIDVVNSRINTRQKYICVSRPRRFGKSVTADMLCAYYGRGASSEELFLPYLISGTESFKRYRNQFNVFHLNMTDFFGYDDTMQTAIALLTRMIVEELSDEYPELKGISDEKLQFFLDKAYAHSGIKFVFIIDEWDCIFRTHKDDVEAQKSYLEFLRSLLKDKPYVALAYMTGILPIKKYGEHSALNMFEEYSMTNALPMSEFTGFTEAEVEGLCEEYGISYEEMGKWYDGYEVDGLPVYNPKSVTSAILRKKFDSYWSATESFEALKSYIEMDMDGLKAKVTRMIAGAAVSVNIFKFQNDMTSFASADDVLTLLVHLGYLSYDADTETVRIPNHEVAKEFINSIEDGGWENVAAPIRESEELLKATVLGDEEKVAELIERAHDENASILQYHDENSLACVITLAYYAAKKKYVVMREMPAGKGYADMVFLPRSKADAIPMIVELKWNEAADAAIAQIRERKYMDCLKSYQGEILLVGVSYDRKDRNKRHQCRIEKALK